MADEPGLDDLEFGGRATYRIVVQGALSPAWSDRLGGMIIVVERQPECTPRTILRGILQDQAALSGVLNTLYDLHLPILSVEQGADEQDASTEPGGSPSNPKS